MGGSSVPSNEKLFAVHGEIRNIILGSYGSSTWFYVQSSESAERYYSYWGKVWPNMLKLKKNDIVDILAWAVYGKDITRPHYYIWEMTKGSEVIVPSESLREILAEGRRKGISELDALSNRLIVGSAILLFVVFIRHLKIRSEQL